VFPQHSTPSYSRWFFTNRMSGESPRLNAVIIGCPSEVWKERSFVGEWLVIPVCVSAWTLRHMYVRHVLEPGLVWRVRVFSGVPMGHACMVRGEPRALHWYYRPVLEVVDGR